MSLTLESLELKLKPPGAPDWTVVDGDPTNPDDAVVVGDFTVGWGRPSPLGHPEPGDISFTVIVAPGSLDEQLLAYDTEVSLVLRVRRAEDGSRRSFVVAFGWITHWTRDTRTDGKHIYSVQAMDVLGRAAASRVGGGVWPLEKSTTRFPKIVGATSSGLRITPSFNEWWVGPRDVDSANALTVLQDTVRPGGSLVAEGTGGNIAVLSVQANPLLQQADGAAVLEQHMTARIPASMLQNTGSRMDRSATITEIAVGGYPSSADGTTWTPEKEMITHYSTGRAFSASRMVFASDALLTRPAETAIWAQKMMAASAEPSVILQPGQVLTDRGMAGFDLSIMMNIVYRSQVIILITGDTVPDVERLQYLCRGRLTINGRSMRLGVEMIPARLFGVRPLRFADLSPTIRPRMKPYLANGTTPIHTSLKKTSIFTSPRPYQY